MEELKHCPICDEPGFLNFLKCKDFTVSKEEFQIVSCTNCGLHFTNPRPAAQEIGKYYESKDYISHSKTKKGVVNKIYHLAKNISLKRKLKLISSLNPKDRTLLDIGCGAGDFLKEASLNGWQVTGIEPHKATREAANIAHGITIHDENILQNADFQSFSIITLWHVLEHVHNLKNRISEIHRHLSEDGHLIIAVPNFTSWDASYYLNFWAAYDVPRHLYHFSPSLIKSLLTEHGFKHVKSLPMKMDAYYVSMLSEKYKKSTLGIFKAIINGFISNYKTKNDAEKYSSVIYIFKKTS